MKDDEGSMIQEAADMLRKMEALRPAKDISLDINQREDCCCGESGYPSRFAVLNTGVLNILNNVCEGCVQGQKMDKELARIVCHPCRKVVLRVAPHTDPDGFKFVADHTYHTNACPVCQPSLETSLIVEKAIYMKNNGKTL